MGGSITDNQRFFLYSKGYPENEVDKLSKKEASKMIAPYYHRDVINYEYDEDED